MQRWKGLEKVTVNGIPSVEDVRALGELPMLRHLRVRGAVPVADLIRLRPLGSLLVELSGIPASQVDSVRDALPEVEPTIHVTEGDDPNAGVTVPTS